MNKPQTEAGRALLASIDPWTDVTWTAERIAAIEAEARATVEAECLERGHLTEQQMVTLGRDKWLASPEAERRLTEHWQSIERAIPRLTVSERHRATLFARAILAALQKNPDAELAKRTHATHVYPNGMGAVRGCSLCDRENPDAKEDEHYPIEDYFALRENPKP